MWNMDFFKSIFHKCYSGALLFFRLNQQKLQYSSNRWLKGEMVLTHQYVISRLGACPETSWFLQYLPCRYSESFTEVSMKVNAYPLILQWTRHLISQYFELAMVFGKMRLLYIRYKLHNQAARGEIICVFGTRVHPQSSFKILAQNTISCRCQNLEVLF